MAGLSSGTLLITAEAVVAVTGLLVAWLVARAPRKECETVPRRVDLYRHPALVALVRRRPLQFVARLPFVAIFVLVIFAGFFGSQKVGNNIAPVLTWTIWWAALIIVVPFLGKAWCFVCPWNAIAEWIQRFTLRREVWLGGQQ